MNVLEKLSKFEGWRDEMVTWVVTAYGYDWVLQEMEVQVRSPWRSDLSDCVDEVLKLHGDTEESWKIEDALMGHTADVSSWVIGRAKTILETLTPRRCLFVWDERES